MTTVQLLRTHLGQRERRARIGLHLAGPMPTIRQLQAEFGLRKSAACAWHRQLAAARREFSR